MINISPGNFIVVAGKFVNSHCRNLSPAALITSTPNPKKIGNRKLKKTV
jgi:hypothetical protein